jgi:hypothetical protein
MRTAVIGILLTFGAGQAAAVEPVFPQPWTHVLPLSRGAISLMADAVERSPLVASLMAELERTDIVVYITDEMPQVTGPSSYLVFLSCDATVRYVLVRIAPWRISSYERIGLLGHELQHALEVAAAPEVRDAIGLSGLYRRIGWEWRNGSFETAAAKAMGNRVRGEVSQSAARKRVAAAGPSPRAGFASPGEADASPRLP